MKIMLLFPDTLGWCAVTGMFKQTEGGGYRFGLVPVAVCPSGRTKLVGAIPQLSL